MERHPRKTSAKRSEAEVVGDRLRASGRARAGPPRSIRCAARSTSPPPARDRPSPDSSTRRALGRARGHAAREVGGDGVVAGEPGVARRGRRCSPAARGRLAGHAVGERVRLHAPRRRPGPRRPGARRRAGDHLHLGRRVEPELGLGEPAVAVGVERGERPPARSCRPPGRPGPPVAKGTSVRSGPATQRQRLTTFTGREPARAVRLGPQRRAAARSGRMVAALSGSSPARRSTFR